MSVSEQPTAEPTSIMTPDILPLEIKNGIFSYLLLGRNVKYPTDGSFPGHKFKFETAIMQANKQLYQDATAYLCNHNDFALVSVKFFALDLKQAFIPIVALAKAAKSFKRPAVEVTIKHLGTKIAHTFGRDYKQAVKEDKLCIALILSQDLFHLTRYLQITYHIWPALPITILSLPTSVPVEYSSWIGETRSRVVWKINEAFRSDPTSLERRCRQEKLLAPLATVTSHGQKMTVFDANEDLTSHFHQPARSCITWMDAVGWDLLHVMREQKRYLDTVLSDGPSYPSCPQDLTKGYMDLARLEWAFDRRLMQAMPSSKSECKTAYVLIGFLNGSGAITFWSLYDASRDTVQSSWQFGIASVVFDSLITCTRLLSEHVQHYEALFAVALAWQVSLSPPFEGSFNYEAYMICTHYAAWASIADQSYRTRPDELKALYKLSFDILRQSEACWRAVGYDSPMDPFLQEDYDFIKLAAEGKVPLTNNFLNHCNGLFSRLHVYNSPTSLSSPPGFHGWTTEQDHLAPELTRHIIEPVDKFYVSGDAHPYETTGHRCVALRVPFVS